MKGFSQIISIVMFVTLAVPVQGANFGASFWSSAKKPLVGLAAGMGALLGYYLYDTAASSNIEKQKKICADLKEFKDTYSVVDVHNNKFEFTSKSRNKSLHRLDLTGRDVFETSKTTFWITHKNNKDFCALLNRAQVNCKKIDEIMREINTARGSGMAQSEVKKIIEDRSADYLKCFDAEVKARNELMTIVDALVIHHQKKFETLNAQNQIGKKQQILGVSCILASLVAGLWYIFKK